MIAKKTKNAIILFGSSKTNNETGANIGQKTIGKRLNILNILNDKLFFINKILL